MAQFVRTFDFSIDGYPDQSFRIVLDSVTYEVRFQWNDRDESWVFHIGDVGTDPTVTMKLMPYVDLLAPFRYMENIPKGNLFMFTGPQNWDARPSRYNIGILSEIQLTYASNTEDVEEID